MHATREELDTQARTVLATLKPTLTPKERLTIPPQPMPSRDPVERRKSMAEVAEGYTPAQAQLEANRCLQCKNAPCIAGCPVHIDIPGFLAKAAQGDFKGALGVIQQSSLLPAICGRVCPQEVQCQAPCTVGKSLKSLEKAVSIGRVERFVADLARSENSVSVPDCAPPTGKRVAVVGSGPASVSVAADLRRWGHDVTILEAFHKPGGVLVYGIPEFRLPKAIVAQEIDNLKAMGVQIQTNFLVGRTRKLKDLIDKDGYDAVFIGSGAGLPKFMHIDGENLVGVFSANEYLTRCNLMKAYDADRSATPIYQSQRVAVLGGGNVAMDAARSALRLDAQEVSIIYRRSEQEMPARREEVEHAKEEGVRFLTLHNAQRILGDEKGRVKNVELLAYELGAPDASGRRSPVPITGSESLLEVDTVIVAIGNDSNPLLRQTTPELEVNKNGNFVVDDEGRTSLDRVWAGGDIVLGAATVILAMGQGRAAAASIHRRLSTEA
ncbi:MAG: NADPH-dependent glutamate synthase [Spirochaetales bacterium]|nr:NADPH-dependent glutamate synthase [Spirochaetales bacterium]